MGFCIKIDWILDREFQLNDSYSLSLTWYASPVPLTIWYTYLNFSWKTKRSGLRITTKSWCVQMTLLIQIFIYTFVEWFKDAWSLTDWRKISITKSVSFQSLEGRGGWGGVGEGSTFFKLLHKIKLILKFDKVYSFLQYSYQSVWNSKGVYTAWYVTDGNYVLFMHCSVLHTTPFPGVCAFLYFQNSFHGFGMVKLQLSLSPNSLLLL